MSLYGNKNVSNKQVVKETKEDIYERRYIEKLKEEKRNQSKTLTYTVIIMLVISAIIFIFWYKPKTKDPIANVKETFLSMEFCVMGVICTLTGLVYFFPDFLTSLRVKLTVLILISSITILGFFGYKIYLDNIYDKTQFEIIYDNLVQDGTIKEKKQPKLEIDPRFKKYFINLKTQKEKYVKEYVILYNLFTIKVYTAIILHIGLTGLLIFLLFNDLNIQTIKDKSSKDDIVLFDDEENIKF